mmetsp:Transcript_15913/g.28545  ORF Transcript_15913/g.28545 Transcript_15913/m.28545 type:complete len:556 (+) Transcript_15913:32-1699(+)|eukprot:CAMPEP_0197515486 /NCGR_PEP_ID=MMETSP1318-20131121/613_1 /TAXON_ID=552666 /ORGANISM="Partenskyella glossopodia, Strain RCC365" /LENGTH=555 /DNA_ID=CAMNT_0043063875 /DNA_START=12 /DNA_END=1679 /DNA_ORIENTATION=-
MSVEAKLDKILSILEPEVKKKKTGESGLNFGANASAYIQEINQLRKKLRETEQHLDITRQLLLRRQLSIHEQNCNAPIQKPVFTPTVPRISRRGSLEMREMSDGNVAGLIGKTCAKAERPASKKALFRLLKANDKKVEFLSPDHRIHYSPQSTNLVRLVWESRPKCVLFIKKPRSPDVTKMMCNIASWLHQKFKMDIMVEPVVLEEVQTQSLTFLKTWEKEQTASLNTIVDFVVCLGGDGTLLWLSNLFKESCPPVISFAMGSLGFLTPFPASEYKHYLTQTIKGGFYLTLRSRLQTTIERAAPDSEADVAQLRKRMKRMSTTHLPTLKNLMNATHKSRDHTDEYPPTLRTFKQHTQSTHNIDVQKSEAKIKSHDKEEKLFTALNEVIVDNAKSTSLTNLDCYCDGVFTTKCQGDGLIVATPSGSTAYSLSAGGSMVHPQVPGILFTPVCPHSLSFRPIVFPDTSKISIRVSEDTRGDHSVAFDGKRRHMLHAGDSVHVSMCQWPIPAICRVSETEDWFNGVRSLLHWNLRAHQKKHKMSNNTNTEDRETESKGE